MTHLDEYIKFIQEDDNLRTKVWEFVKDYGISIKDLYIEPPNCKSIRTSKNTMYLIHGTKPHYVKDIKKEGLKITKFGKRTKEDNDIMIGKSCIWFSTKASKKKPGFGGLGKLVFMIAKVDTKYIKKATGTTYQYFKDVPVKDIIWESDKNFKKITKEDKCLLWT